jgi:hypothetical protein
MAIDQEKAGYEQGDRREWPLSELLKQLSDDTTRLVHQEIELAKAELTDKGRKAGMGAGLFGGAGMVGFLALAALTTCFILALDLVLPAWLAALLVAVVYGAIAAVLAMRGRAKVKQAVPAAPEQTIETVKEDVKWAKTRLPSARR